VTAALNGSTALVAGVKLVELAVLGLALIVLVRTRAQFEALVDVLLIFTLAADVIGLIKFVDGGGGRQASFLGEHDFAALSTLPLLYGLALLANGDRRRAWIAIVAGSVGCILGAALASLLGLYLGAAVLIVIALAYRRLRFRQLLSTVLVVAAVTGGTLEIRSGDLGFLQSWFGKPASRPGQYASSWSQRLIYTYIGGKIFAAHPILGTGWYGVLPPRVFDAYLPAAHRRFSDQPASYFPPPNAPYIPQQTFDQVLYELGAVGGAALLALLVLVGQATVRVARNTTAGVGAVPAAWLAAALGALAGEALFGGAPLVAIFWVVVGVGLGFAIPGRTLS
jgi:O-antigen ligase